MDPVVHVPFEVVDGRIYVQARVNNGGPYRFAIDTGASGVGRADTTLVGALGLRPHGKASTSDGVQAAVVDTVRLDSLALGGLEMQGVELIARDYGSRMPAGARFHGIIGRDFFADGLLVLDYHGKTLSFSRRMSLPDAGEGILPYERAFRVPVSIGGIRAEANLDTGANIGLVMPKALYTRVSQAPLAPAGAGTLTNTRIDTWRGVVPGPVTIGAASLPDVDVRVSDRFPEMLVGAHVLQEFVVLIDQRAKRIALCRREGNERQGGARLP
ncbi:aspartyl protease family protein [Massilia sp. UMI-21]|nr:aspartyl protease family protein [Massilia sp. UMI-21]